MKTILSKQLEQRPLVDDVGDPGKEKQSARRVMD
jgi:hypothetical protein